MHNIMDTKLCKYPLHPLALFPYIHGLFDTVSKNFRLLNEIAKKLTEIFTAEK